MTNYKRSNGNLSQTSREIRIARREQKAKSPPRQAQEELYHTNKTDKK